MARDEFTKQTNDVLGKRVGIRCSNSNCRKLTTGPRSESQHIVNIGVAAHITAAAEGGPRYDPRLTPEQRSSPENGIWLCQNCAKLVDNDPARYTVELLRAWKNEAEFAALAEVEGRGDPQPPDTSAEVAISFRSEHENGERHDYRLEITVRNVGTEPLGAFHVDVQMPARVVHQPEQHPLFIRDRSTREIAFFRRTSADLRGGTVYPGDTEIVMTVSYFVITRIFQQRGAFFDQPVTATLYLRGFRPVKVMQTFRDLQRF